MFCISVCNGMFCGRSHPHGGGTLAFPVRDLHRRGRQLDVSEGVQGDEAASRNGDRQLVEVMRAMPAAPFGNQLEINALPQPLIIGNLGAID